MYVVNGKPYDDYSDVNWKIKNQVVKEKVVANVTDLVTMLHEANEDDFFDFLESFENMAFEVSSGIYYERVYTIDLDDEGLRADFLEYLNEDSYFKVRDDELDDLVWQYRLSEGGLFYHLDQVDVGYQHVCEFWIVEPDLGKDLMAEGEPVLEREGGYIWGRAKGSERIAADDVIRRVCINNGWLEGQESSWETRVV